MLVLPTDMVRMCASLGVGSVSFAVWSRVGKHFFLLEYDDVLSPAASAAGVTKSCVNSGDCEGFAAASLMPPCIMILFKSSAGYIGRSAGWHVPFVPSIFFTGRNIVTYFGALLAWDKLNES